MSKITLEPNDSGAGTFSIVSPDSNINRTLTLPDEAGTILSDASTIDSNNLQSDVYKQDNILGTVSESGGVPTGAIIERGSNSNGEFVKYADGTLICTTNVNYTASFDQTTFTYPSAFTSIPMVSYAGFSSAANGGSGFAARMWTILTSVATSQSSGWRLRRRGELDSTLGVVSPTDGETEVPISLTAIGRWY